MNNRCILIAEDDVSIRQALADALTGTGYTVHEAGDGRKALEILFTQHIDLALLDVNMPEADGFKVLAIMEKECPGIPAIMLTARGEETDRIKGLQLGADDYVVKPFSILELMARITAVLRRSPERPKMPAVPSFPGGTIDPSARTVIFDDGRTVALSEKEFDLLVYFLRHPNRIIAQEELLIRVWGKTAKPSQTRTIPVTLARLREKLGSESALTRGFENMRGIGYSWTPPVI